MARRRRGRHPRPANQLLNEVRSFSGFMRGERIGSFICYRSRLERDALTCLEFDPAVLRVERNDLTDLECAGLQIVREREPYRVRTPLGGYTPDLRVTLADRVVYVEVGPSESKGRGREREKLLAARAAIEHDGYAFVILTERELREGHRAANCAKLLSHLVAPIGTETERDSVEEALRSRTAVGDLTARLASERGLAHDAANAVVWHVVARAAHEDRLVCDLDGETLDTRTLLSVAAAQDLRASA